MRGVNKVILVGNLGKDPELKKLDSGTSLTRFPMATSESYIDKEGNKIDLTEWHNVVLWRGLADVAEKYLKKGSKVYIEGKLKTRNYQDADNNTRYTTEVVADQMVMLDSKGDNSGSSETSYQPREAAAKPKAESAPAESSSGDQQNYEDDLPF
ncbi:MAG: single-stranded DNA-binding protein [Chitinophagales bacterium]